MTKERDPLMESARIALLNKEIAEARTLLEQVVKESPENYHALLWLAGIAETPAASLLLVEKAKAIAPTSSTVAQALAWAQKHQNGAVVTPPPGVVAPATVAGGSFVSKANWGAWHWMGGIAGILLLFSLGWGILGGGKAANLVSQLGYTNSAESVAFLPTTTPSAEIATATISLFHLKSTEASQTAEARDEVAEITKSAESTVVFQLTEIPASATPLPPTEQPTATPTERPLPTETPQPIAATPVPTKSGLRPKLVTDSAVLFPTWTPTPKPTAVPTAVYVSEVAPTNTGNSQFPSEYRWIDVDLTNQSLTAYENGLPVYSTLVSSGLWDTPTVTGQYRIYLRLKSQDMNGYNIGYDYFIPDVPYVMYFTGNYALHGAYWHNDFGKPRSHGCVNLSVPDAEWLFNFSQTGTLVNVHY